MRLYLCTHMCCLLLSPKGPCSLTLATEEIAASLQVPSLNINYFCNLKNHFLELQHCLCDKEKMSALFPTFLPSIFDYNFHKFSILLIC